MAILDFLHHWAPFRIDALGIVTILGAAEVDMVVGRLARHHFTGCLPLLCAFQSPAIILSDNFQALSSITLRMAS